MEKKSNHFLGQIGFVLAAASSAVGVGNLWRFPYLAAKDGWITKYAGVFLSGQARTGMEGFLYYVKHSWFRTI